MKKNSLNPAIIILIIVLFCFQVLTIVSLIFRLVQPGGADTLSDLVSDYQTAVNNGDEDLYLSLVPRSETNSYEKEAVSEKLSKLKGNDYQIAERSHISKGSDVVGEVFGELFVLDPFGSPIPSDVIDLSLYVTDKDNNTSAASLTVLEINGKYFIHDLKLY